MPNKYKGFSQLLQHKKESELANKKKQQQIILEKEKQIEKQKTINELAIKETSFGKLRTQFPYICYCNKPIIYDTLFLDDISGRYIPLEPDTPERHRCNHLAISTRNKKIK